MKLVAPLVLALLDATEHWSRGALHGFAASARDRGWELLHYPSSVDLEWLVSQWSPAAAVLGPGALSSALELLSSTPAVVVNADRTLGRSASVIPDEDEIGRLALSHFAARGLKDVTTFRLDDSSVAVAREAAFVRAARNAGVGLVQSYPLNGASQARPEDRGALSAWLQGLPKPCGLFACTDRWARVAASHARAAKVRVPEDLALIGCDNDLVQCELISPPLSSIAVPWVELGRAAAELVHDALLGRDISLARVVVPPLEVVARRSSDVFAVDDELVAEAVAWIYANVTERVTVPMVARAVGSGRQRLERRFRACLGRTIHDEVRRARIEVAKRALSTTSLDLRDVARQAGFSSAALLSVAFQKELGMPPGAYRRRARASRHDEKLAELSHIDPVAPATDANGLLEQGG